MRRSCLALFLCLGSALLPACADGEAPVTPELRPMSLTQARQLISYLRRLRVEDGANTRPIAWSMVNISCEDRTEALEYGIARAADPADTEPVVMPSGLTAQQITALAAAPAFDAVSINVAGPLVTFQTLVLPDGTEAPGEPDHYYWAYHHTAAINVEGTMKVIDLSISDEPIDIQTWLHGFVPEDTACFHMSDTEFQQVWVYWNSAFGNFDPMPPLERLCGYTLTPLFTFRRDQAPADQAEFISTVPLTMVTQLEGFKTLLAGLHSTSLDEEQLPSVTSRYRPGTVDDVCAWAPMKFCGNTPADGGVMPR